MRISDWSSDVCSSDLADGGAVAGRGVTMDEGEVGDGDALARHRIFIAVRVDLPYRVADRAAAALDRDRILDLALIADVLVDAVVLGAGDAHIFDVRTAAEVFHAVVRVVVDLDMVVMGQFKYRVSRKEGVS